jgi:hypothetical protein
MSLQASEEPSSFWIAKQLLEGEIALDKKKTFTKKAKRQGVGDAPDFTLVS